MVVRLAMSAPYTRGLKGPVTFENVQAAVGPVHAGVEGWNSIWSQTE